MREEELENKAENDKRMPEANCACTLETCNGEETIKRETCMDISRKKKLLVRDEGISPTRLSEMINKEINDSIKRINNSIKDAMQTLVKCSMEEKKSVLSHLKEPKELSDVCQSRVLEEYKKSPNRQTTSHTSRRCNNLSTFDKSYSCIKMHKSAIPLPVKNKVNNERKNKKHLKSTNNANTDNRRMTGNVNIYICSETNNNNQDGRKKLLSQLCTASSSNTVTEQSNSRSTNASTTSSCKLINSIKEKRKKLLMQQAPNFIHEKTSDDNTVCDNRTLRSRISRKGLSEAGSKEEEEEEEADVKVNDENVWCKDTTLSSKDGHYCKDTDSIDLQQDSSYSTVPCSSFSVCDNTRRPPSWITLYPSDDSDVFLSRAISNMKRRGYRKNKDRDDVRRNDSEYTVCHAIDDSKWLSKSIYTDCATYDENPKKHFIGCKYRNKILQGSVINWNDIRKRQAGCKLLQQSLASCQREQAARKWSICSCIAEEEEDYCKDIGKLENQLSENVCNVAECLEKISVCRTPSKKLAESAAVCETSVSVPEKCFEKTRNYKDSMECSKGTSVCGSRVENSGEPAKVTKVCKEFVTEESSEDITVCKTVFGEPNGLAEEVIVYRAALPDSEDTPKETVCKQILDLNFANQDDVNRLSLNDAKAKLVEGNINSPNLNGLEENAKKRIIKLNNKQLNNDNALNNFTRQQSANVKQHEQIKETLNNQSKNSHQSVEPLQDSLKSLSKNAYSTTQLHDHSNLVLNSSIKKTSKTLVNQQKMQSLNRSIKNHSQRLNNFTQNLASNKNNQLEEKPQENSKEKEKNQDSKEIGTTTQNEMGNKQKERLLQRSVKKLIDVIKRGKTLIIDRIETGKIEVKRTIVNGKKDNEKSEIISEAEDKIDDIKDQQEIKKMIVPIKSPQTEIANKGKKMDIQRTDQTMPKLLRIISAKRSHIPPTVMTTDSKSQKPEILSVPPEIITTTQIDEEKIAEEKIIMQEHTPAEITEEVKMDDSIALEMNITAIETNIEDAAKDIADEDGVPKDIRDETIKIQVPCPQKKPKKESQEPILCKCGLPSDSTACSCSIAKCAKYHVPCPQKKSEEEEKPQKYILCKRELAFNSNNYLCSIVKCKKCNNIVEECPCKNNNRFERKKIYCTHCRLSTMQCTCAPYLKSCLKVDKPKFPDVSPLKISSHVCMNCSKAREERKCRKTAVYCHSHQECKCRRCAICNDCSRINDECTCGLQASCINCGRPRNQCCCTTFALVKCHKIKEGCNRKRTMICLYCDNPRDKCTCRAPIGKCSYCGLPSDVCNCQDNKDHVRDCEQIARRPDENRTIRVTRWKPKREIRRYFARNFEDFQSCSTEECQCYEKPKRQRPEELPYQRLNIFSEVMNELQRKMSESVCCARCWRNPCCCESPTDQDKRKEEKKAENHVKRAEIKQAELRSKSPNNCQCNPSSRHPRNDRKSIVQKSVRHIGCICRLTPCRCKKGRFNYKKPLAKCYYCKSLPCTCVIVK